jgi:YidC/Oxa1 family membrane protein insertase
MLHNLWDTILYEPFVNFLAFLISVIPGGDVGIAIILLTIIVKTILFPLSQKSLKSQAKMNALAPHLNEIKASGANKEEQAKMTFDLYKKHKTNPFSGCLLVLVQIPIIFALYYVFYKGMDFNSEIMYSFIKVPEQVNMMFLGLVDIASKSWVLALIAGVSQYLQAHFMPKPPAPSAGATDFAASFSKSMHLQMKYFFPIVVTIIAYTISGAIALYWATSNIYSTIQQIYVNKKKNEVI